MTLPAPVAQGESNPPLGHWDRPTEPTRGDLIAIGASAFLLRFGFFLLLVARFHVTVDSWSQRGDGPSYLAQARSMLGSNSAMTDYDRRVFPGYPALIAMVHLTGIRLPVAALLIDWCSGALVAVFAAALFRDRRIGWACVMLIPQFLINSTMAMSEAPMLALATGGLLLARRRGGGTAGAMLGAAGLVRPVACFAVLGFAVAQGAGRKWRSALVGCVASATVVAIGIIALWLWTGDAFHGVKVYANHPSAYGGHLLAWPFQSLIEETLSPRVDLGRAIYIWTHVILVLLGCGLLAARCVVARPAVDWRDALSLPWLAGNTAFVLCIGSYWGFQHFPRFTLPALPAFFWAFHRFLPHGWYVWTALAIVIPLLCSMVATKEMVIPR